MFNARPIDVDIERYCVKDAPFLPQLWNLYWERNVVEETEKRVRNRIAQLINLNQRVRSLVCERHRS